MRTVTVIYHHEDGSWWAESDDVPGFSALADSLNEVRRRVRSGLQFHFGDGQPLDLRESIAAQVPAIQWTGIEVAGEPNGATGVVSVTGSTRLIPDYRGSHYQVA